MSLTRLAVRRPVTTLMGCLVTALLGWNALQRLSVDLMPDVTLPMVSVTALYEGASPEEIETLITRPLEQTLGSVQGVEELSSTSLEGSSTIRVQFAWGTNLDSAISDMRARIERIRPNLPEDMDPPYIRKYDVADSPVIYLGLASDRSPVETTMYAERTIVPRLERVDGVARVRLRGRVRREIQVALDRGKLQTMNIGVGEIVQALQRENVNQPAGYYQPGHRKLLLRSQGQFRNLEQIRETVVRNEAGALVRLRDIAEVTDGHEEITELSRINGERGLMVYIYKQSGANMVRVSDRVREAVGELNDRITRGYLTLRVDNADYIRNAISNIRTSALYGMGLAFLVLVVFLRSFRSTLIIGVTMPLAVLATFILIYFQGFTLNIVSFGGLALGIGLLVDNSIVVLESIFRKREEGLEPKPAAVEGTQEVASAIVASTITTLIVFLPLLFISGVTGILLNQLAWVVSFSLFCSLIASLTLTPMLCAYWLGRVTGVHSAEANGEGEAPAEPAPQERRPPIASSGHPTASRGHRLAQWVHDFNRRAFGRVEGAYERLLRFSLRRAGLVGFLMAAALAASIGLTPLIGTEFLPSTDQGRLHIHTRMAAGIRLETLSGQASKLENVVFEHVPEAKTVASFIGDDKEDANDWNECRIIVRVPPRSRRKRSTEEIRKVLADKVAPVAGMNINVEASTEMSVLRRISWRMSGGSGGDLSVEVRGHDLQQAEVLAERVLATMQEVPGLVNAQIHMEEKRPELVTTVDRPKAALLGLGVGDVTQTLETSVRGTEATVYREGGDEFNIRVWLQEPDRAFRHDVERVSLASTSEQIPLRTVARFDREIAPLTIERRDQQRFIGLTADVEDRDLGSTVADLQQRLRRLSVPDDFSVNVAGEWEHQQESFANLQLGFGLALVLMYMVMASQFESLRDPVLILVSVPLAAIGVILMLACTETTLNVQSFIGLVMLAGIVVNNAIVLVDYVNQLRRSEAERDLDELIVRAAHRRFRPILMTMLTTVLAMIPIAVGWGEGGELQAPMARVVIGGLLSSTLVSLLAIPLVYRFADSRRWRHRTTA